MSFSFPARVYYEDTDSGGVVYYANYFRFLERARTEWLRSLGISQDELARSDDAVFAVVQVTGNYRLPARLDDLLNITADIVEIGRSSLTFAQQILRDDGELLFHGEVRVACLTASGFKPRAIPEHIRTRIKP